MKTLLHAILYLATTVVFTFLYWEKPDISLWGAMLMAGVTSALILLPIPTRWGKTGYVGFGLLVCLLLGMFLFLEKEIAIEKCMLYSAGVSITTTFMKYWTEKYNAARNP